MWSINSDDCLYHYEESSCDKKINLEKCNRMIIKCLAETRWEFLTHLDMRNHLIDNELYFYAEFVVCNIGWHRAACRGSADAISLEKPARRCV